mmetsp:Transcript_4272/g.8517  ORF Transcript_4272/g.8517 Transcript_4272/m.8517 type:complete len:308 (-) Transcript_4272:1857-2780(-)
MSKRRNNYNDAEEGGALDDLSRKLASDLRKHVRRLGPYSIFSREWLDMVDSLQHITNIALMEQRLPKKSEEGTLWERDELTIRFVLEEGKLNLALRLLSDLRDFEESEEKGSALERAAEVLQVEKGTLETRMRVFEQSLGLLLNCSLRSVESLQTADLPLLLTHILRVLRTPADAVKKQEEKGDIEKMQESQCLYYLLQIGKFVEDLDETKVMHLIKEKELVPAVLGYLVENHEKLRRSAVEAGLDALARVMGEEDFGTYRDSYLTGDATAHLVRLQDEVVKGAVDDFETRRRLRPLLDQIERAKRA